MHAKRTFPIIVALSLLFTVAISSHHATADDQVVVNGQALGPQDVQNLQSIVGQVWPGRYWYDTVSGLWGYEGGPAMGQIASGLQAAPLASNASGSGTGTFVNGREIHPIEYKRIADAYGYVLPGRFWMDANFTAGYEGGPPAFSLAGSGGSGGQGGGGVHSYEGAGGRTEMMHSMGSDGCIDVAVEGAHWSSC